MASYLSEFPEMIAGKPRLVTSPESRLTSRDMPGWLPVITVRHADVLVRHGAQVTRPGYVAIL
jgi:hypothetical protein